MMAFGAMKRDGRAVEFLCTCLTSMWDSKQYNRPWWVIPSWISRSKSLPCAEHCFDHDLAGVVVTNWVIPGDYSPRKCQGGSKVVDLVIALLPLNQVVWPL